LKKVIGDAVKNQHDFNKEKLAFIQKQAQDTRNELTSRIDDQQAQNSKQLNSIKVLLESTLQEAQR
jgi:hypothetical protein